MSRLKIKQLGGTGIADQLLKTNSDGSGFEVYDLKNLQKSGTLGYYATVYTVGDAPSGEDHLDPSQMNTGDLVFNRKSSSQWELSILESKSPVTWNKIADNVSASSKTRTITASKSAIDPKTGKSVFGQLYSGDVIYKVTVVVKATSPEDELSIGNNSWKTQAMNQDEVDLNQVGTYETYPNLVIDDRIMALDLNAYYQNTDDKADFDIIVEIH